MSCPFHDVKGFLVKGCSKISFHVSIRVSIWLGRFWSLICICLFFIQSRCPHRSFIHKRHLLHDSLKIASS